MRSVEVVGRSKDDAVEKALKQLGLSIDEVDVQVLAEVKPFLGFIGKPECKVKVTAKENVKKKKEESLEDIEFGADFFKSSIKEERKMKEKRVDFKLKEEIKKDEVKVELKEEIVIEEPCKEEVVKEEVVEEFISNEVDDAPESIYADVEGDVRKIDFSSIYNNPIVDDERDSKVVKIPVLTDEMKSRLCSFFDDVFSATDVKAEYEMFVADEAVRVKIKGEDATKFIGRRGDALDSLQLLAGLVANKGEEGYTRVVVDIEDYRQKREESIVRYANKMARQAAKQKRPVKLDAMNPYERRIVHAALQSDKYVNTSSEGKEPYRRVVITPKNVRKSDRQKSDK